MTSIHDDLLAVLDAVEIASATRYSVLGWTRDLVDGPAPDNANDPDAVPIVLALARTLYDRLYIRPQPRHRAPRSDSTARLALIAALSKANTGRGAWEPGWTIRRVVDDGGIVAAREGVDFWVDPGGFRLVDGPVREGGWCRVRVPKELREMASGFYMAVGDGGSDAWGDADTAGPRLRYYWHLEPAAAVPFVAAATSRLAAAGVPYRLKVPDDPGLYHRADAGLIFLPARHRSAARKAIAEIYSAIAPLLRADVPLFTRRLADGLGLADDPGGSRSFGQHRCHLIARSLWDSFVRGEHDRDSRAAALASAFRRDGLDPLRPHLGPGGADDEAPKLQAERPAARPSPCAALVEPPGPLEAAIGIGRELCRTAYWDREGQRCNWTGRSSAEMAAIDAPIIPTLAALGPHVYGGSAGIALFLAQLHQQTRDPEFRLVSLGAIDNALRLVDRWPSPSALAPLSFFCGHTGVAYAAQQVGQGTGSIELAARAHALLDRVAVAVTEPHVLDVIGGNAGAIPALLAMARFPGFERCFGLAIELAEDLCRTAIRQDSNCRWDPDLASAPGMASALSSGMSHGAGGIGLALLEAYAVTRQEDMLETARGAFAYEDTLFDPLEGNWRDLRLPPRSPAFARGWCHGAPGIAMSRLRAAALDPERAESYLALARAGFATTVVALEDGLAASRYEASPVNGLSGLIEILFIAGRTLGDSSYVDRAREAARTLIIRHGDCGDWTSGAPSGGPNPSLMVGTAGIGYTFLRLHDPDHVPSVLWIGV
jgi:lantibiotic biosynthesis protein